MTLTYYSKVYNDNIKYSQINFGQWMKSEGTCISNQMKLFCQTLQGINAFRNFQFFFLISTMDYVIIIIIIIIIIINFNQK